MARTSKPHDMDDEGDEDRPRKGRKPLDDDHDRLRKRKQGGGMPAWGWVLLGVGGLVFVGGGLMCAGMLWVGKKTGEAIQERAEQNQKEAAVEAARANLKIGEPVTIGPLTVKLRSVTYSSYSGSSPSGAEITSSKPGVLLTLEISTTDQTKEYTAKGATGSARLTDQFGNGISHMRLKTDFGFTCQIHGQLKEGSSYAVRSDKPLSDTLVFAEPVQAASTLTLTLDAGNYGGKGKLVFEIPKRTWKSPSAEDPEITASPVGRWRFFGPDTEGLVKEFKLTDDGGVYVLTIFNDFSLVSKYTFDGKALIFTPVETKVESATYKGWSGKWRVIELSDKKLVYTISGPARSCTRVPDTPKPK